ncbi:MAG: TetR family transcriptional regulator [Syntrophobacterales bacterium]|nr:TetR family transcriptional regulator [Syntrophobacterales bacterium]
MDNEHEFKELDKSKKLQEIIDTALDLFHAKGYKSTTIDDISKELGISKAAIYHYVESKDELLSIIYTQAFENIFRDTNEIAGMDIPPDEKLRRIIHNHITNIIIKKLSMFSVFFSEENQVSEKDFQKIRAEKKKYTAIVEEIIKEGISKGIFAENDPKLLSYAIIGMCNWIYKWYKPQYSPYRPEEIADHFIRLLGSGCLEYSIKDDWIGRTRSTKKSRVKKNLKKIEKISGKLEEECRKLLEIIDNF